MAKRVKKTVLTNISESQMNEALTAYAKADASIVKINADLDVKFTKLRDEKADELAKLEAEKSEAFDLVQAFALENKETQFSKKKSLELSHGVIGFRIGTPKLKNKKGFTWAAVTNLLKEFFLAISVPLTSPQKISYSPIGMTRRSLHYWKRWASKWYKTGRFILSSKKR